MLNTSVHKLRNYQGDVSGEEIDPENQVAKLISLETRPQLAQTKSLLSFVSSKLLQNSQPEQGGVKITDVLEQD